MKILVARGKLRRLIQPHPYHPTAGAGLQPAPCISANILLLYTKPLRTNPLPSPRIPQNSNHGAYFLTLTVRRWYYLFDRHYRWHILARSLEYCRKEKGLKIFGFVFMLNHIHLLVSSPDISGFVRDFKKFTSKELRKNIEKTEPNILPLFLEEGNFSVWEKTNMPKRVETDAFFFQKLEYIHQNPVKKEYVMESKDWYWSSANPLCEIKADDMDGV